MDFNDDLNFGKKLNFPKYLSFENHQEKATLGDMDTPKMGSLI